MAKPSIPAERRGVNTLGLIALLVLVVLVGLPILFVAFAAITDVMPRPGNISLGSISLQAIRAILTGTTLSAAMNSLLAAFGASIFAVVIGAGIAVLVARTDVPLQGFVRFAGISPLFIPAFVAALSWSLLASPQSGLINVFLRDLSIPLQVNAYSMPGLIFVLGAYYSPYVFMFVSSALALMNPELEEASLVHGASMWNTVKKTTLSLMTPAILSSGFLVFLLSVENFPVAQFLASPAQIDTLPTFIYRFMNESPPRGNEAAAIAMLLVGIVLAFTWLQRRILSSRDYATVGGKGAKQKRISLGKWKWPFFALVGVWSFLTVILPVGALLLSALYSSPYIPTVTGMFERGSFSLDRLIAPLQNQMIIQASGNSFFVAVATAVIATFLVFVIAYLVYRTKFKGRNVLESLVMMPLAVPAIVMGIGLLWTWLVLPVPVYGTLLLLVIAFTATQLPQAFRGMSSSMLQVNGELEESAMMHGSNRIKAVATVTAPLMRVGIGSTFVLMLMLSLREITVPLFLYNTNTRLVSIAIFDHYENGSMQNAAALSIWYILAIAVIALVASRFGMKTMNQSE